METFYPGDVVFCAIKDLSICSIYYRYDELKPFQIIGRDSGQYIIFVPDYIFVKDSFKLDASTCKKLQIETAFIGENICYVQTYNIHSIKSRIDGAKCLKCKDFCYQATPCREGFICYACKQNPYRS